MTTSRVGKYLMFETLGKGSFGKVKLGVHEDTGERVAIKVMDKEQIKACDMTQNVRREINIMKALEHRNIVNLRQVLNSASKLYIVMDLVTGGELFTKIYKHGALPETLARKYFQELVEGVSYCHSKGVYHRDLKPENLLIDEATGSLKITDFGLSTMLGNNTMESMLYTLCGSPNYCAPELITRSREGYSGTKVDAWACGIVLFALLTGYLPFYDESNDMKKLYSMIATAPVKYPSKFPADARDLVEKLVDKNPATRWTVDEIKTHPWFQKSYAAAESKTINNVVPKLEPPPRRYHFKAAAAKSMKDLTLKSIPQSAVTKRAESAHSRTPYGEKLQRVDDVLQRFRIVFQLKTESMELRSEMKRSSDLRGECAARALVVAEATALRLKEQLVSALESETEDFEMGEKEVAAFEELIRIFGKHATSGNRRWWTSVGSSNEENTRIETLVAILEPVQLADDCASPVAGGHSLVSPRPKRLTDELAGLNMSPIGGGVAGIGAMSFVLPMSATECLNAVGRILGSRRIKFHVKKNENKLRCEIRLRNGDVMQVTMYVVTENAESSILVVRRSRNDTSKRSAEELQIFAAELQELLERETQGGSGTQQTSSPWGTA